MGIIVKHESLGKLCDVLMPDLSSVETQFFKFWLCNQIKASLLFS